MGQQTHYRAMIRPPFFCRCLVPTPSRIPSLPHWLDCFYTNNRIGSQTAGRGTSMISCSRYCRVHCKILCHRPETLLALLSASSMCSMPCLGTSINALCNISSRSGTYVADNQSLSGSRTASSSYPGLPLPGVGRKLPRLQLLLRGIRRISSRTYRAKPRFPITPSILRRVYSHLSSQPCTWDRRMIWAAMCVCFFGFLRSGEVCTPSHNEFDPSTHLAPVDVSLDSRETPSRAYIQIKASKTDPFRTGVTIVLGATGRDLCPIAALTPYLALRGPSLGPLFQFQSGSYLTRARFVAEI